MDFTTSWQYAPDMFYQQDPSPQMMHHPSNQIPFFQNPARIAKPPKRYISPRGSVKRKINSVSALPTRTRSVIDRRPTFPQSQSEYARPQNRPISWHPLSVDHYSEYQSLGGGQPTGYLNTPFTTAEVNGVITPLSLPLADEPQIQDIATPLDELSGNDFVSYYPTWNRFNESQNPYWPLQGNEKSSSDLAFYSTQDGYAVDYNNMYNQFHTTNIATAPASPNLLPIQSNNDAAVGSAHSLTLVTTSATDELVGMGLYDSPAEVQSSMLGMGPRSAFGARGSLATGLKLEDSFEPPEIGADDEDEGEEDAEEDGEEMIELHLPLQGQTHLCTDVPDPQNLANQSFYFDQDYILENSSTFGEPAYSSGVWEPPQYGPYGWV